MCYNFKLSVLMENYKASSSSPPLLRLPSVFFYYYFSSSFSLIVFLDCWFSWLKFSSRKLLTPTLSQQAVWAAHVKTHGVLDFKTGSYLAKPSAWLINTQSLRKRKNGRKKRWHGLLHSLLHLYIEIGWMATEKKENLHNRFPFISFVLSLCALYMTHRSFAQLK